MDLVKSLTSTLTTTALKDTAKLVVIGSTVEATRRATTSAWNSFVDSFFLTAHFSQEDYPYDWILHWLAKQPSYSASREFDVASARTTGSLTSVTNDIEDEADLEHFPPGVKRTVIQFMPSYDITHSIYYSGHWLKITRSRRGTHGYAEIKISVVARNNNVLKQLVLQARREYEADMEHRVHIYLAEGTGWRWNGAQKKRPLSSVVLEPGVKDMLIADAKDFLASEAWYADRGIPYRRGYLLYGVPGSGKTSLIHAIAGELSLDIYVVSLSAKGMSDNTLASLLGRVPARCILLLEGT
ncbi:hypothetical protein DL93DRAFT_1324656 [Clavulina sp. PMI_390]|nr:hypothetical protein DL93DRAFT_1324656 [Clavulina sp. PMI_390]